MGKPLNKQLPNNTLSNLHGGGGRAIIVYTWLCSLANYIPFFFNTRELIQQPPRCCDAGHVRVAGSGAPVVRFGRARPRPSRRGGRANRMCRSLPKSWIPMPTNWSSGSLLSEGSHPNTDQGATRDPNWSKDAPRPDYHRFGTDFRRMLV